MIGQRDVSTVVDQDSQYCRRVAYGGVHDPISVHVYRIQVGSPFHQQTGHHPRALPCGVDSVLFDFGLAWLGSARNDWVWFGGSAWVDFVSIGTDKFTRLCAAVFRLAFV